MIIFDFAWRNYDDIWWCMMAFDDDDCFFYCLFKCNWLRLHRWGWKNNTKKRPNVVSQGMESLQRDYAEARPVTPVTRELHQYPTWRMGSQDGRKWLITMGPWLVSLLDLGLFSLPNSLFMACKWPKNGQAMKGKGDLEPPKKDSHRNPKANNRNLFFRGWKWWCYSFPK